MPYIAASDFVLTLPRAVGSITGSSTPLTIGEVATILEQFSARLDGALAAAGYAVPIASTATQAYSQAQDIVGDGAGWRVLRRLFPNQGGPGDKMTLASEYRQDYIDAMQAIKDGDLVMVGAGADSGEGSRQLPRSFETGPNANATQGGASPIFEVGMVF